MPVPGNHPICAGRCGATHAGVVKKTLPSSCTPQTSYPRTHLDETYQIQTINKTVRNFALPEALWSFLEGCGSAEQCLDARRKQCIHADDFGESNVAIATVCNADDRWCCTLTPCVAAQRFAPARSEALHVPVHHALKPAQVREPRASRVYRNIS